MISAARTTDRSGFTLIEIVVVLAIAAVLSGGAIAVLVLSSDDRALRNLSGEIEVMAKRARTISILQQTPYALEFRPGEVRLLPFAEAGEIDRTTALGNQIGGRAAETEPGKRQPVRTSYPVPEDVAVLVRRWNTQGWIPTNKGIQIWRFDPDGLCEPVSLRYVINNSWAEDVYHPLTATIRESTSESQ